MDEPVTGRIVKDLDVDRWVLNAGLEAGVEAGDRFVVFELGEEVTDPETGQSLGALELVKGYLRVAHVQARMSVAELESRAKAAAPPAPQILSAQLASTSTAVPGVLPGGRPSSVDPRVGDHVRRVASATPAG
jgi:hypothetical protein